MSENSSIEWALKHNGPPGLYLQGDVCIAIARNQEEVDEWLPKLLRVDVPVRAWKGTPLLGPVDLEYTFQFCHCGHHMESHQYIGNNSHDACGICSCNTYETGIDWAIIEGESGPNARPMHPDWARSIRDQCQEAGAPFFMKQMDKVKPIPDDLMIREFPQLETEQEIL